MHFEVLLKPTGRSRAILLPLRRAFAAVQRPADDAPQGEKVAYSTHLAKHMAMVLSEQLTAMGVPDCRPNPKTGSGAERSFAGGIGSKQVDVSYATEEIGLIFGISIKGIYFPDATRLKKDGHAYYAKNLVNRKGDMLAEATTLHKRFPYAEFERLLEYLGSEPATEWLRAHCHKAANGYLRLQSNVLRQLPIPRSLGPKQKRVAQLPLIQ